MDTTKGVLDYAAGLATAMGNESLYHELLGRFREQQKDFKERLESVMAYNDSATAIRYTHSLKGLAGNIGAKTLQAYASKLEYALMHERDDIDICRVHMLGALRDVQSVLASMTLDAEPTITHDLETHTSSIEALCKELKTSLEACDSTACDIMRTLLHVSLRDAYHESFEAMAKNVFAYQFDDALTQLSTLENRFHPKGTPMNSTPWNTNEPKRRYKLLVIDDLADNIALISNVLKEEYDITVATSAQLGLELARKEPKVDLILLDIVMPVMDGYEVCTALKAQPFTKDIPIIFLTVLDETADVAKGFRVGGVDYVTKPFDPIVLKARVKTHCELSYQRTELRRFNQSLEMVVLERTRELEQTQLYVERLARQAALGDVIGMIAHQWRQPVAIISMIANNVLLDIALDKLSPEETTKEMNNISKQTQFLSSTIDNFRNFFKPSGEKQEIIVSSFFESLHSLMSAILSHHAIELRINTTSVETLYVYKNELLQVMVNLINNAKDAIVGHNVDKGVIELKTYVSDNDVVIEVNDNGGGIAPASMEKLAEPYFTTKGAKEGTGLGLYMSQMITQKHLQGRLEWSNTEEGASFRIRIPKKHP